MMDLPAFSEENPGTLPSIYFILHYLFSLFNHLKNKSSLPDSSR